MVGQCYMEAGDTGIYQHRHKDAQLRLQHTGVAVMRLLLTDGQLVVDGQLRQTAANGPDSLDRKTGTVFSTAAVFIGALVKDCRAEAAAHTVTVDLHHVKPGLDRQLSGLAEAIGDLFDLLHRQLGDVWCDLRVQQGTQLLHRDFLGQHAGHILEHGKHVGIRLVQLRADTAVVAVDDLGQLLVIGKALLVKQRFLDHTFAHRHIADDDHGAAARSDAADFFKILLVRQTEGRRRKDDAVFQLQTAVIDRTIDRFVHDAVPPVLLFPVK